jgi:hypothetical protein
MIKKNSFSSKYVSVPTNNIAVGCHNNNNNNNNNKWIIPRANDFQPCFIVTFDQTLAFQPAKQESVATR